MLLAFKRLKNAPAAQKRQLLNPFDHQADSVSFSCHTDPKKINLELNELTGHINYYGTYSQNHIRKCSKHHNVTGVLKANSKKSGVQLGIKPMMEQLSCYSSALEFFPSFTTFDCSHESQANSAATVGLCNTKST